MSELNLGHEIELRHTAFLALEFFDAHVREHALAKHLEKTDPAFAAKLEAASDALYAVYNSIPWGNAEWALGMTQAQLGGKLP